jgi:predicted regulator of Ras-like GTPase activity (Roadblock/LC7/MglB family)
VTSDATEPPRGDRNRSDGNSGLDWLLEDLVSRLAGGEQAIVLSADGLLVSRTANLSQDDGEHLSAVASGLASLARGASRQFQGGGVRQTVVEMDHRLLIVTAAGQGASLALIARDDADLGMVAYEMNLLVKQVGSYLSASPRNPTAVRET